MSAIDEACVLWVVKFEGALLFRYPELSTRYHILWQLIIERARTFALYQLFFPLLINSINSIPNYYSISYPEQPNIQSLTIINNQSFHQFLSCTFAVTLLFFTCSTNDLIAESLLSLWESFDSWSIRKQGINFLKWPIT